MGDCSITREFCEEREICGFEQKDVEEIAMKYLLEREYSECCIFELKSIVKKTFQNTKETKSNS